MIFLILYANILLFKFAAPFFVSFSLSSPFVLSFFDILWAYPLCTHYNIVIYCVFGKWYWYHTYFENRTISNQLRRLRFWKTQRLVKMSEKLGHQCSPVPRKCVSFGTKPVLSYLCTDKKSQTYKTNHHSFQNRI